VAVPWGAETKEKKDLTFEKGAQKVRAEWRAKKGWKKRGQEGRSPRPRTQLKNRKTRKTQRREDLVTPKKKAHINKPKKGSFGKVYILEKGLEKWSGGAGSTGYDDCFRGGRKREEDPFGKFWRRGDRLGKGEVGKGMGFGPQKARDDGGGVSAK